MECGPPVRSCPTPSVLSLKLSPHPISSQDLAAGSEQRSWPSTAKHGNSKVHKHHGQVSNSSRHRSGDLRASLVVIDQMSVFKRSLCRSCRVWVPSDPRKVQLFDEDAMMRHKCQRLPSCHSEHSQYLERSLVKLARTDNRSFIPNSPPDTREGPQE